MKHILKVASLQNLPNTRPLIAMDENGNLFGAGEALVPEGFVDFGLPSGTLWYSMNLGATNGSTPESWYGDYYAWGETETKNNYSWSNYKYANGASNKLTKYCNDSAYGNDGYTDELTELVPSDDVAESLGWKMPTKEDFDELAAGTISSWVENYNNIEGLNGRLLIKASITPAFKNVTLYTMFDENLQPVSIPTEITEGMWATLSMYTKDELDQIVSQLSGGQINDVTTIIFKNQSGTLAVYGIDYGFKTANSTDPSVSMFIPAAGYYYGSSLNNVGSYGNYWSSSLHLDSPDSAWDLNFRSDSINMSNGDRYYGRSIRPVLQN